jgi:hypothetical protein
LLECPSCNFITKLGRPNRAKQNLSKHVARHHSMEVQENKGMVEQNKSDDTTTSQDHHHHVICDKCSRTVDGDPYMDDFLNWKQEVCNSCKWYAIDCMYFGVCKRIRSGEKKWLTDRQAMNVNSKQDKMVPKYPSLVWTITA